MNESINQSMNEYKVFNEIIDCQSQIIALEAAKAQHVGGERMSSTVFCPPNYPRSNIYAPRLTTPSRADSDRVYRTVTAKPAACGRPG